MNFFSKLVQRFQRSNHVSQIEEVPLAQLVDWIGAHAQEIIVRDTLVEELELYKKQLGEKCAGFRSQLQEWEPLIPMEQKSEVLTLFNDARKMMDLLRLVEKSSLAEAIHFHVVIEPKMERFIQKIMDSSLGSHYSFLLTDVEKTKDATLNPLLQMVLELNDLRDTFEQKVTRSGFRAFDSMTQRALQLKDTAALVEKLSKDKSYKQDRLQLAHLKRGEKEQELEKLTLEFAAMRSDNHLKDGRIEEAQYRVAHFTQQAELLQEELFGVQEALHVNTTKLQQEQELVEKALQGALQKKVTVVLPNLISASSS
ncbi:TPA: hypothetical protein HA242_06410 [Candidatus Woesearchaeota archaeon]|nr:hypothetical protein [Candidatus Woesearchaeota archaeon]